MKLRHLETLHAILQTGSVTSAAKFLGVSQPSVSVVLQHCELQLGMQLFERKGGRLKATPEALALLPEIREIFRRVARVNENARALVQGRLGRISVGGTLALANGYLVEAVKRFRDAHPNVEVTIHSLQTPDLVERVVAQEIDLGVCYGPVSNNALVVEELVSRPVICVMPAGHRLAGRPSLHVKDLEGQTLISYVDGDWLRNRIDSLYAHAPGLQVFALQVSQTITAIELVKAQAGIALVEPFFFDAMKPDGLVAVPVVPVQSLTVEIVRHGSRQLSAAASAFLDTLRATARYPSIFLRGDRSQSIGQDDGIPIG